MNNYKEMQNALSELLNINFERLKKIPDRKTDAYKKGVLDCKSRLHNYEKYEKIPTLEQVQKEWEEEGFEVICSKERFEAYKQWIERHQRVSHHTSAKIVIEKDFFYIVGQFSNKYTHLLTKTFKSLVVEDE